MNKLRAIFGGGKKDAAAPSASSASTKAPSAASTASDSSASTAGGSQTRAGAKRALDAKYEVGKALGSGTYATVRLVTERATGKTFAGKAIDRRKIKGKEGDVLSEIEIMSKLEHPNLGRVYESFDAENEIWLIQDLAEGGELLDQIMERGEFSEKDAAKIVKEVCEGLAYLHQKGIVHRDLKPENILFRTKGSNDILITDFGFSRIVGTSHFLSTICGTPNYVAPEILTGKGHGIEVDMWSTGCIAYAMLCGYLPFSADSQAEMFDLIKSGRFAFHVESWSDVSPEAKDFISKLLIVDPSARMKAKDAVEHPWLTKFAAEEAAKVADLSGTIKRNASRRGGIGTLRKVALQSKVLRALGSQNTSTSGLVESRVANAPAIPEPDSEASFEKGKEEIPDLTEKVAGSVAAVTLEAKEGEVVKA